MFSKGRNSLSYGNLIKEISEESILSYYTNIEEIPCLINSPLREDSNPSLSVFYSSSGRIHFKDFGTQQSYNLVGFLIELLNFKDYTELINHILTNMTTIKSIDRINIRVKRTNKSITRRNNDLQVKTREWRKYDLDFWKTYGISLKWLEFGNVYPIKNIFISGQKLPADKYAYCYVEFKDNKPTFKIYQPYSNNWKWINNHDSSVWDLWTQAMRTNSDNLIITSSRKDALTLWANLNIPSVSLQSEGTKPKCHVVKQLQAKFKNIWCLYDNDYDKEENYGREFSLQLSKKYNFKHIEIPEKWLSKDPSDLYYNHGKEILVCTINNLIKSYKND